METIEKTPVTAEQIHKEFFQSFEKSEHQLIATINKLQSTDRDVSNYESYVELSNLGFRASSTVKKARETVNNKSQLTTDLVNLQALTLKLEELKLKYPYKIISYGQIMTILEKYNLFMGRSEAFTGIIPVENAKHINNYSKSFPQKNHYNSQIEVLGGIKETTKPVCVQEIQESRGFHFFICALFEMFEKKKDQFVVGREIFYDPSLVASLEYVPTKLDFKVEDPIVLHPIYIDNQIAKDLKLFHVVSAWGPEAKEPEIFNEILN